MLGGHQGVFVYYMMILYAANREESFVSSRGDARGVCQSYIFCICGTAGHRVLDTRQPAASVGFVAYDADVAANVKNIGAYSDRFKMLCSFFGGIAFSERANVDRRLRVADANREILLVDLEKIDRAKKGL